MCRRGAAVVTDNLPAMDANDMNARLRGTLPGLLGIRFVETGADRVVAELTIRDDLRTVGGALHGGTLMAFADTVGAAATIVNLPAGATTTTLESKTNFFAAGRTGVVRAESTPAPPREDDDGLADAHHRRERKAALAHHPDADGAARVVLCPRG